MATFSKASCPAKAGHPVTAGAGYILQRQGVLGGPLSRTMTTEEIAGR
jgi:hypothetical protein